MRVAIRNDGAAERHGLQLLLKPQNGREPLIDSFPSASIMICTVIIPCLHHYHYSYMVTDNFFPSSLLDLSLARISLPRQRQLQPPGFRIAEPLVLSIRNLHYLNDAGRTWDQIAADGPGCRPVHRGPEGLRARTEARTEEGEGRGRRHGGRVRCVFSVLQL